MEEPHLRPDPEQIGVLGRPRGLRADPQQATRPPQQRCIPDRLGRRQQHQPPGLLRQRLEPPTEALLDPAGQPERVDEPEPTRQLSGRHIARQLQQSKRVPLRLGDDPVDHLLIHPPRQDRRQHRARVGVR